MPFAFPSGRGHISAATFVDEARSRNPLIGLKAIWAAANHLRDLSEWVGDCKSLRNGKTHMG